MRLQNNHSGIDRWKIFMAIEIPLLVELAK
jgi:hypothetical protein